MDETMHQYTVHESQFGFMPDMNTTDAMFLLKQAIEKHRERQTNIRVTCTCLEKAYDRIPMEYIHGDDQGNEICRKCTLG